MRFGGSQWCFRGSQGVPGGLRGVLGGFKGYLNVPGALQRISVAFQGVSWEGLLDASGGPTGVTRQSQGRFMGSHGNFRRSQGIPGVLRGVLGGLRDVPGDVSFRGKSGGFQRSFRMSQKASGGFRGF